MVKHSNYWFETCATRKHVSAGLVRNVDVLIIGGGITGMNLLYRLISSGISNTFLVEEASVGFHSSGRGNGQLQYRTSVPFYSLPDGIGQEYLEFVCQNNKRFARGLTNVPFETDMQQSGGLRLAADANEMQSLKEEAAFLKQNQGMDCPLLTTEEVRSILPSAAFCGGMFMPSEFTFNPYKVVNGLMDIIERQGVRVLTGTQVENVAQNKDGSLAVSIRHRGIIQAGRVVYCINGYTPELLRELEPVMTPFRGQMVATDILPPPVLSVIPSMSMSCNNGSEYFRLHNGKLLVGGMRLAIRGRQEGIVVDGENSPTVYDKLRHFVSTALPFVNTNFSHTWTGIMCSTKDSLPIIGAIPNRPNEYVITGCQGYGFSHALLSSMIIKDLIMHGESTLPGSRIFSPARFS
jgi:glycine/D-amino acid oxidase-like deaminating enzyme